MGKKSYLMVAIFCTFMMIISSSNGLQCSSYTAKAFKSCTDLPVLNSFLHWTYDPLSYTLEIAYRHAGITTSDPKWVAWAINPTSTGMVGSQSLVAYQTSDGSMAAYTSPITGYQTSLAEGPLKFNVSELSATYQNNEIAIFATLDASSIVSSGAGSTVNHIWQDGPVSGDAPQMHETSGPNIQSIGTLNLLSAGQTASIAAGSAGGLDSKTTERNIHGVLNTVSWGILMPIGVIIARYMRVFPSADPAWFYLHVSCQLSAYIIGAAGWATGLRLGFESPGVVYTGHRQIGIALFCLGTNQMFALLLRPKKDHKYRIFWNIYHHTVGYTTIILGITNIFVGLKILNPGEMWKNAYVGVLVVLGFVAVLLEVFTWYVVFQRKKSELNESEKLANSVNGGYSAHGGRPLHSV